MTKTRTNQAMEKVKEAQRLRASANAFERQGLPHKAIADNVAADFAEANANELLALETLPVVTNNEVVPALDPNVSLARWHAKETLSDPDAPAVDASCHRIELLCGDRFDITGMAVDAAASVEAKDPLTKMLIHQATMAHEMAMRFGGRALKEGNPVEASRAANTSLRLMATYQQALLALQRLKTGGGQTVTVRHQHITVGQGAQAVIAGTVQSGRGLPEGSNEKSG